MSEPMSLKLSLPGSEPFYNMAWRNGSTRYFWPRG